MELKLKVGRLNRILSILSQEMSQLSDEDRDLPIRWNVMHMYSSAQIVKILCMKRGLNIELGGIIAALHDIGVVRTKRRSNHAEEGAKCAVDFIKDFNEKYGDKVGRITEEEKEVILEAISEHSNKEEISSKAYVELMKDVDSIDRYLHGISSDGAYKTRIENVLKELNMKGI